MSGDVMHLGVREVEKVSDVIAKNAKREDLSLEIVEGKPQWVVGSAILMDPHSEQEKSRAWLLIDAHTCREKLMVRKLTDSDPFNKTSTNKQTGEPALADMGGKQYWVIPLLDLESREIPKRK